MVKNAEDVIPMDIYTNIHTADWGKTEVNLLNIYHLTFNTFGEETSVEPIYLEDGETMADHMEFKKDASGMMLNYKILVKDNSIDSILHNNDGQINEVPFNEHRLGIGSKIVVDGHNMGNEELFCEVEGFPVAMLVCNKKNRDFANTIDETKAKYPLQGTCRYRHPERLPGYIDVLVLQNGSEAHFNEPIKISVQVGLCKEADEF